MYRMKRKTWVRIRRRRRGGGGVYGAWDMEEDTEGDLVHVYT